MGQKWAITVFLLVVIQKIVVGDYTKMNYWKQRATPWVSIAVLAGGLASACILLFVFKIEGHFQDLNQSYEEEIVSQAVRH